MNKIGDNEKKEVEEWFNEYIFGFMKSDLEGGIKSGLNYLTALGLASYTEVLGGLTRGKFSKDSELANNFKTGWDSLGDEYKNFGSGKAYGLIRSALVHQYFVRAGKKGIAGIVTRGNIPFVVNENGILEWVVVEKWKNDLVNAAKVLMDEIISNEEKYLLWKTAKKLIMGGI